MVNILFVTKSQLNRGSYWRGWYLGSQLSELGHNFTLVCPNEYRNLATVVNPLRDNFRVIALPRLNVRTTLFGMAIRSILSPLVCNLGGQGIVHICAPSFPETHSVMMANYLTKKPVVVDVDDWWGFDPDRKRSILESRLEDTMEIRSVSRAERCIVVSDILRTKLQAFAKEEVKIIPNGFNPNDFGNLDSSRMRDELITKLGVPKRSTMILTTNDEHFHQTFVDLGSALKREFPTVFLVVVGLQSGVNHASNIVGLPRLDRQDWLRAISGTDVLLFLMENTMWEKARFPIKLVEYLATGKPIISSAVGESRRVMELSGYSLLNGSLFVDNTSNDILRAIRFVMTEPAEVEHLTDVTQYYVQNNLSWPDIAKSYISSLPELQVE